MGWLAPLAAIGSSIVGGLFGSSSVDKANKVNAANAAADRQLQLDSLQKGIQWRVADAKAAGISPLAALGASTGSYIPVSQNFMPKDYSWIGDAGQDLSRAITAGQTARERTEAARALQIASERDGALFALELENRALSNDMLRSQIARLNSAQVGPGAGDIRAETASPGLPPGSILDQPSVVTVGSVGEPERQPGHLTDYQFAASTGGRYTIVPSNDMKQRIEDTPQEWQWFLRNGLLPDDNIFRSLERQHPSRPGHEWRYNPFSGHFWQRPLRGAGGVVRRRHY